MIEVLVNNEALDISEGASLSYTLNNSIFTSADTSQLPGSYSFPFEVPATQKNRRILDHANQINAANQITAKEAVIRFEGVEFAGTLMIESASNYAISIYIVVSVIGDLKDTKLTDLDLGGNRTIGTDAEVLAHAKETAQNPEDFDYVFFPVLNQRFIENLSSKIFYWFQNYWNSVTQLFECNDEKPVLTPFPKIKYLLDKIFLRTGYVFKNEFQTNEELDNLVMYSNTSLYSKDGIASSINLRDHVPSITCTDYLKRISSTFCLGIFLDTATKVIRLIPLQKVLSAPAKHDWTSKVHHGYTIDHKLAEVPADFAYAEDSRDSRFAWLNSLQPPTSFEVVDTYAEMFAGSGNYYVKNLESYWQRGARTFMMYKSLGIAPNKEIFSKKRGQADTNPPRMETQMQPLIDVFAYSIKPPHTYNQLPRIDQPGTVEYKDGKDDDDVDIWKEQRSEMPVRFTFYRGIYEDGAGNNYPMGCAIRYDAINNELGQYSLNWDGDNGVYATWWRRWHNMLLYGKHISRRITLSPSDLNSFQFDHKVRIANMDYIIKSIKVNVGSNGLLPCDVSMVSVV